MKGLCIVFFCVLGAFQVAAEIKATSIAVVNLKDVAKKSDAGQSIDEQLGEINDKSKKDLLDFEASIKQMDNNAKTSSDERKVEDLQAILYDMTKEKRYQIQEAYQAALEQLEKEIHEVIKEISVEKGYSVVVTSDAVVFNNGCPDITEEALQRLNKRISRIKVDMKKGNERKNDR